MVMQDQEQMKQVSNKLKNLFKTGLLSTFVPHIGDIISVLQRYIAFWANIFFRCNPRNREELNKNDKQN